MIIYDNYRVHAGFLLRLLCIAATTSIASASGSANPSGSGTSDENIIMHGPHALEFDASTARRLLQSASEAQAPTSGGYGDTDRDAEFAFGPVGAEGPGAAAGVVINNVIYNEGGDPRDGLRIAYYFDFDLFRPLSVQQYIADMVAASVNILRRSIRVRMRLPPVADLSHCLECACALQHPVLYSVQETKARCMHVGAGALREPHAAWPPGPGPPGRV